MDIDIIILEKITKPEADPGEVMGVRTPLLKLAKAQIIQFQFNAYRYFELF